MDSREAQVVLESIVPFSRLAKRKIKRLVDLGSITECNSNDIIYSEGSNPDYLFILLKGRVAVSTIRDSKRHDIEILKRGICFGVISLLTDDPHSVTSRSIEKSYVLKIPKMPFKEFLKKEPILSLEFSSILSQRVKARSKPKEIFQSKKIAVVSRNCNDRQKYAYELAVSLAKETGKKSIVVFLKEDENSDNYFRCQNKVLPLKNFQESILDEYIQSGDCDCITVIFKGRDNFLSLFNFLSESYHFILYEIADSCVLSLDDIIVAPADQVHFLTGPHQEDIHQSAILIKALKARSLINAEKIKVIIFGKYHPSSHSFDKDSKQLTQPIYAKLEPQDKASFDKALKRISREIGEITVGLALGSGAAYGFSHIGVLKVLERESITIDMICGSSMGAIIAALWAAGFSHSKIREVSYRLGQQLGRFAFTGFSFPFRGIMKARRLEKLFKDAFGDMTFYDLEHSLKIVAFDFRRRIAVVLDKGPVYKAVAASCAFPGFFEPVSSKTSLLLDGGILHPLPTKILFKFSVHKIIASNITLSSEEAQRHYSKRGSLHVFDFIFGSIETMQQEFVREASKIADIVMHPRLEGLGWLEFERVDEFISRGEVAAQEKIEDIKKLASY